jgi:large subunit ribosomal protein L21
VNKYIPEAEKEYAIFETGGKQYQAVLGKTLAVEKIEVKDGDNVSFDQVLFIKRGEGNYEFGRPLVQGAVIKASIVKQTKGPKLVIFKFKKRKKYRVKKGHRQPLTVVRFESF